MKSPIMRRIALCSILSAALPVLFVLFAAGGLVAAEVPNVDGDNLVPSCDTDKGVAYPPVRLVELAKQFGDNGVIQSICQKDFRPAMDAIIKKIGTRIGRRE